MRATERQRNAPSEGVIVERLRTEATNWINAVALQSGRIDRRFRKQHADHVELQTLEVDLHFFLVAAVRLRRCIEQVSRRIPGLSGPLATRLHSFDTVAPSLLRLRNVSEHIDEYNLDQGRDDTVSRRQVQTWYLDTSKESSHIAGQRRSGGYWSGLPLAASRCGEQRGQLRLVVMPGLWPAT